MKGYADEEGKTGWTPKWSYTTFKPFFQQILILHFVTVCLLVSKIMIKLCEKTFVISEVDSIGLTCARLASIREANLTFKKIGTNVSTTHFNNFFHAQV